MKSGKILFLVLCAVFAPFAPPASAADLVAPAPESSQRLVLVLTTADQEIQMMALILATQGMRQGAPVEVLLCGAAGDLALADARAPLFKPLEKSPVDLLVGLLGGGAQVAVCALYLPNRETTGEELRPGVTVAAPAAMAARLLDPQTMVWSF